MIDLLIRNALIVTVNKQRQILKNCALAIEGDLIFDIGPTSILEKKICKG